MNKLWIALPAFAPDYSGVCSAMFELGGISVIHDASGCTGNYTGYDEPRWYGTDSKVFCSGLREIDAVLGRDDKLIDEILYAVRDTHPKMITVLGSPVPMVIGTDMEGIARELEEKSGLPAFGFNTNGLSLYNKGVSQAMAALIERFTEENVKNDPQGVNILGMTPLDFSLNENAQDIAALLEKSGYNVIAKMMMGTDIEHIAGAGAASVNLVVTESGMAAAKLMQKKFGIPYVAGLPMGDGKNVLEMLSQTLADKQCRVQNDPSHEGGVLIVAEQLLANALRHEILKHDPQVKVTVGTMFGLRRELAAAGDIDIPDESTLRVLIASHRFKMIVGDPLFEGLISPSDELKSCQLPHPAVSSKLYWDDVPRWLGGDMAAMAEKIIMDIGGKT